jgi:hypothetical protein
VRSSSDSSQPSSRKREAGIAYKIEQPQAGHWAVKRIAATAGFGAAAERSTAWNTNQSYLDFGVAAIWELDLFGGLRRGEEHIQSKLYDDGDLRLADRDAVRFLRACHGGPCVV